ncbi:MAG: endosialidase [Lachnospiraceae bacterium]|nr:endosialidase [Candidatus Equihabitans merdae]
MSVIDTMIRNEENGSVSFGNYTLQEKTKVSGFQGNDGIYKVKTFAEMTRLEKDELFAYESEPGTAVLNYAQSAEGVSFSVEGPEDAQITVAGEPGCAYNIIIDGKQADEVQASLGGKVSFSVSLEEGKTVAVEIAKA